MKSPILTLCKYMLIHIGIYVCVYVYSVTHNSTFCVYMFIYIGIYYAYFCAFLFSILMKLWPQPYSLVTLTLLGQKENKSLLPPFSLYSAVWGYYS
jgi:hypothetical protein